MLGWLTGGSSREGGWDVSGGVGISSPQTSPTLVRDNSAMLSLARFSIPSPNTLESVEPSTVSNAGLSGRGTTSGPPYDRTGFTADERFTDFLIF